MRDQPAGTIKRARQRNTPNKMAKTTRAARLKQVYQEFVRTRAITPTCDIVSAGTLNEKIVWHCFTHNHTWDTNDTSQPSQCPAAPAKPHAGNP